MAGKVRLLYLEDDASTRGAMAFILAGEGCAVHSYGSAEEAAGHLQACDVDVALLDVRLSGRFGDDFGRELAEKCPRAVIIFLTAEVDVDRIKRLVPRCLVLRKPADVETVLELVRCKVAEVRGDGECSGSLPFPTRAG